MIDIQSFIDGQLAVWPKAKDNFDALKNVKTKEVTLISEDQGQSPFVMKVQFNPARMVSTGAKMDAATLKARPCFLCGKNRPAEQEGIEWGEYVILVNPFPIFPRHLTIPLVAHKDQLIGGRLEDMARLALELPEYAVFYNGQKCGASAPDHMHFQAGNRDFLPLIEQIGEVEWIEPGIGYPKNLNIKPGLIVAEAQNANQAAKLAERAIALLPKGEEEEPMINVLSYAQDGGVRFLIIPRKKHRPSFYGTEPGQMVLSPASVDLAGVLITPRPEDFEALKAEKIEKTLTELCYNPKEIRDLCKNLK